MHNLHALVLVVLKKTIRKLCNRFLKSYIKLSRSQNTFSLLKSKKIVFLHEIVESPYLNQHYKFHDFFPWNNEDKPV